MTDREYPLPRKLQPSVLLGSAPTIWDIDLLVTSGRGSDDEREWGIRVWDDHVSARVAALERDEVPQGLVASCGDVDVVVALKDGDDVWDGRWHTGGTRDARERALQADGVMTLTEGEVALAATAIGSGSVGMALAAWSPVARLRREAPMTAAAVDVPQGGRVAAVIDDYDPTSVLDVLLVLPGPHVLRRSNGKWREDDGYLTLLRGLDPPTLQVLSDADTPSVLQQVDEATASEAFKPTDPMRGIGASAFVEPYEKRADEMAIEWALVGAAADRLKRVEGHGIGAMPLPLKKYWTVGRGAAKIRWGTPGAMTRCARQLRKYVGVHAYQVCNNLSKPLGGKGVAWDVGHRGR